MAEALTFAAWMKRRRSVLGLTQKTLAKKLNYAEVSVGKVEKQEREPGGPMIQALVAGLEVPGDLRPAFIRFAQTGEYSQELDVLLGKGAPPSLPAAKIPTNLPALPTPLVGRGHQVRQIAKLLTQTEGRVVTLTGTGGTGKSRLALELGHLLLKDFPDGVWFIDLAPIREGGLVASTVARVLGIREEGSHTVENKILDFLKSKRALLLLDNFEQLLTPFDDDDDRLDPARGLVVRIRDDCKHVKFLVTSREYLHIRGEKTYDIPALSLPDPKHPVSLEDLRAFEAVELFIARAQDTLASFELTHDNALAVAEICNRLDGLPLAIELAAARISVSSPAVMLQQLAASGLDYLRHGPVDLPSRQRRMSNAIAWSYGLLDDLEKTLFRRLGVFVGGCTLEAAQAVLGVVTPPGPNGQASHAHSLSHGNGFPLSNGIAPAPSSPPSPASSSLSPLSPLPLPYPLKKGLDALAKKSLLRIVHPPDGERRYMLLETIREFTVERLKECLEFEGLQKKHATYFVNLGEAQYKAGNGPELATVLDKIEQDHSNIRVVLEWYAREADEVQSGLQLASALWQFWLIRGYIIEGRTHLERLLTYHDYKLSSVSARAYRVAGTLALYQCDYELSYQYYMIALEIQKSLGDDKAVVSTLNNLGVVASDRGKYETARSHFEECLELSEKLSLKLDYSLALGNLANLAWREGSIEEARRIYEQVILLQEAIEYRWGIAVTLLGLGRVALLEQEYSAADEYLKRGVKLCTSLREKKCIAGYLECYASLAWRRNEIERAIQLLGAADKIRITIGAPLPPADQKDYEEFTSKLKTSISDHKYQTAWGRGQMMGFEEAVAFAQVK